jgi:hypothetical protein
MIRKNLTCKQRRKKLTFSKRFDNGQLLKAFLTPVNIKDNKCIWNFAIAVSRSNRQINDWNSCRKNKRANKLKSNVTGNVGSKSLIEAARITRKCFVHIQKGDSIIFKCESSIRQKQLRVFKKWLIGREKLNWEYLRDFNIFFIYKK